MAEWKLLTAGDSKSRDMYRQAPYRSVQALVDIDSATMANLVPMIKIQKLNRDGVPEGEALSNDFYTAPAFGTSIGQFPERPAASIESVTVKDHAPRGWYLFSEITINMIVHRPDAVFGSGPGKSSAISAILDMENELLLTYGWVGQSCVLTDGMKLESTDTNDSFTMSQRTLRFRITHYNFSMTPDGQIKFTINALQNGEMLIRNSNVFAAKVFKTIINENTPKKDLPTAFVKAKKELGSVLSKDRPKKSYTPTDNNGDVIPGGDKKAAFITLKEIFDILFTDVIEKAAQASKYDDVALEFDIFNSKSPKTIPFYLSQETAGKNIGDFKVQVTEVIELFGQLSEAGESTSVYGFMNSILRIFSNPSMWIDGDKLNVTLPEIWLRTTYDVAKKKATFQVVDRKTYLGLLKSIDADDHTTGDPDKKALLKTLLEVNNIPKLELYAQGSYVKDAKFDVIWDERMTSIFVLKQLNLTRDQLANSVPAVQRKYGGASKYATLYRSAVKGEITIVGNFIFNVFGMIWIQFGIWPYDNIYSILEKTDTIGRDGFTSSLSVIANGLDPLGVGRMEIGASKLGDADLMSFMRQPATIGNFNPSEGYKFGDPLPNFKLDSITKK